MRIIRRGDVMQRVAYMAFPIPLRQLSMTARVRRIGAF